MKKIYYTLTPELNYHIEPLLEQPCPVYKTTWWMYRYNWKTYYSLWVDIFLDKLFTNIYPNYHNTKDKVINSKNDDELKSCIIEDDFFESVVSSITTHIRWNVIVRNTTGDSITEYIKKMKEDYKKWNMKLLRMDRITILKYWWIPFKIKRYLKKLLRKIKKMIKKI